MPLTQKAAIKVMQTIHYTLGDEFCIFIQKHSEEWFRICGSGKLPYDVGQYVDSNYAAQEFERLAKAGFKKRLVPDV